MCNVVKPIVAGGQHALLGEPAFSPRIGRVDAEVDHLGDFETPFAYDAKALMIPVGIGDQIDRDDQAERAGEFQRLKTAPERDALAVFLESLLVDRLQADEDVLQAEGLPEAEYLLVAKQYVAAGFEVVALFDAGTGDRLAELHGMALMDKGDVVDDEDPGFTNAAQILDDPLRANQPIAAPVKGPSAAERAIPRAAAGEFDRGARIKDADKILAPMAQQVARRHDFIERMDEGRRRPLAGGGDSAGNGSRVAPGLDRRQQHRHRRFAFAFEYTVDRARAVIDQRLCDE